MGGDRLKILLYGLQGASILKKERRDADDR